MPTVSTLFGIVIRRFHKEHGRRIFTQSIKANRPSAISMGKSSRATSALRVRGLIRQWALSQRAELEANFGLVLAEATEHAALRS